MEALTGALFLAAAWLLVVRHGGWTGTPERWGHLGAGLLYLGALVALTFIDLDHRILPDRITKPGMAAGALCSVALPDLQGSPGIGSLPPSGAALLMSLAGMALGYGSLWLVGWLGEKAFRREAMGLGDCKLLGMVGAFTGPVGALLAAGVGLLLGLATGLLQQARTRDAAFPFGPALAAGGAAVFLAPEQVREGLRSVASLAGDPRGGLAMAGVCGLLLFAIRDRLPRPLYLAFLALVLVLAGLNGVLLVRG